MSYNNWSVVANEIPTALKWNQLGLNDEALRDGSAFLDNIILPKHILSNSGALQKVSGGFLRYDESNNRGIIINANVEISGSLFFTDADGNRINGAVLSQRVVSGLRRISINANSIYSRVDLNGSFFQGGGDFRFLDGGIENQTAARILSQGGVLSLQGGVPGTGVLFLRNTGQELMRVNNFGVYVNTYIYMNQGQHLFLQDNKIYLRQGGDFLHWIGWANTWGGTILDGAYVVGNRGVVLGATANGAIAAFEAENISFFRNVYMNNKVIVGLNATLEMIGGVVAHGGYIPLPAGFSDSECRWMAALKYTWAGSHSQSICGVNVNVNAGAIRRIEVSHSRFNQGWVFGGEASFWIEGLKGRS